MRRKAAIGALAGLVMLGSLAVLLPRSTPPVAAIFHDAGPPPSRVEPEVRAASLAPPGDGPARVSCTDLSRIMDQVLGELVEEPQPLDEVVLATSVRDWLDPHGFWSAAPDSAAET